MFDMSGEIINRANLTNDFTDSLVPAPVPLMTIKDAKNAILFGAGGGGRFMLSYLRQASIDVRCFCDNNSELWGKSVDGISVYSPEQVLRNTTSLVVICSSYAAKTLSIQCEELGCQRVVPYFHFTGYPFPFPDFSLKSRSEIVNNSDVHKVRKLWKDDISLEVYQQTLKFYGSLDVRDLPSFNEEEYFQNDLFDLGHYRYFVDGGAYNGDTLKKLLEVTDGAVGFYAGFEPDKENFQQLKSFCQTISAVKSLRLDAYSVALGSTKGIARFSASANPCSTFSESGNIVVEVNSIDNLIANDQQISFIKLDIEGGEIEGLQGAISTIHRCRPALAICVYHQVDHLWKIPLMIDRLGLGYSLYLRKHSESYSETVCYAVPSSGDI